MNASSFEAQYCNTTCGLPNENAFVMLRSPTDPNMPWPGFVFGFTTASIWYWGTDQVGIIILYIIRFNVNIEHLLRISPASAKQFARYMIVMMFILGVIRTFQAPPGRQIA